MRILVFIVLLLLTISTSLAQESANYVVIEQPTNVRASTFLSPYASSYSSAVLSVVTDGSLSVTGRNFEGNPNCGVSFDVDRELWLRVDLQGITGWVNYCVVDFYGNLSNVPMVEIRRTVLWDGDISTASSDNDHLGIPPETAYVIGITRNLFINVREEASQYSRVKDVLSNFDVYVIRRTGDSAWVKVEYDAQFPTCRRWLNNCELKKINGWVASYLLRLPHGWQDIVPVVES